MKVILSVSLFLNLFIGFQAWALTNSTPAESADAESVIFFSSNQYDSESKEEMPGYCNGNLIADRVMVTAAHCVFMAEALKSPEIEVQVGEYRYVKNPAGETRRVGYVTVSKEKINAQFYFTTDLKRRLDAQGVRLKVGPSEDLAVVVFDRPLKLKPNFQFGSVASQRHIASVTANAISYWATVVTINPFAEITTMDTKKQARLDKMELDSGSLESRSTSRVEAGDSGAPLLARLGPQWQQIGVTKGRAETFFSNWDVFSILDNKMCNIAEQIADPQIKLRLCYQ